MTKQPHAIRVRPDYPRPAAITFQRACFAAFIDGQNRMHSHAPVNAEAVCRSLFPGDEISPLMLQRSPVDPGDSATGWAAEIAEQTSLAFLKELASDSAAAKLIARGTSFTGDEIMLMPRRAAGPVAMPWVAEGGPVPVAGDAITGVKLDEKKKLGVIVAFTRETAKKASAQAVFDMVLSESAAKSLDSAYFAATDPGSAGYAGLLYGATDISGNGLGVDAKEDLAALARRVASGSGEVVFVTGPGRAAALGIMFPDLKADVFGTGAVSDDILIGIDPLSFVHAVGPVPNIAASIEATVHMDTAPEADIGDATTNVRSYFQTDSLVLRATIDLSYVARRSGAVAFITPLAW